MRRKGEDGFAGHSALLVVEAHVQLHMLQVEELFGRGLVIFLRGPGQGWCGFCRNLIGRLGGKDGEAGNGAKSYQQG